MVVTRSPVEVRTTRDPAEADAALDLAEATWGARPLPPAVLRAMELAGSYVAVAVDEDDTIVGMCAGLVGFQAARPGFQAARPGDPGADDPPHLHLHSHLAAVDPAWRGRGVGRALKAHQRDWCRARGIGTVSWTFDPLVVVNARFNLHHLGARVDRYLVELYGVMDDALNRGDPSDRLLVAWDLGDPVVDAALTGPLPAPAAAALVAAGAVPVVSADGAGPTAVDPAGAPVRLVAAPDDVVALRAADPPAALAWRHAVRDAILQAETDGLAPVAVTDDRRYVLADPTDPPPGIRPRPPEAP